MTDTKQGNFQSDQNFDIDVPDMYKHFVTGGNTPNDNETGQNVGIDDLRGQISVSVTSQTTADLIKALNISPDSPPAPTTTTSTPVQKVQESRCHTFYRIIGFPVVSMDKSTFYNPGFDSLKVNQDGSARKIILSTKIMIAKNIDPAFASLSQAREVYAAATSQIFSVPTSVEAGVLSLTSGTYGKNGNPNLRKFAQPFIKNTATDPFNFSTDIQSYSSPGDITSTYSKVGTVEVLLSDYQDVTGDPNNDYKPNPGLGNTKVLFAHQHIITPFMVDPRIDFSIWGSESSTSAGLSKRVAIPFVPNASYLKVSDTATAERPLLEKVVRDRFASFNSTTDVGTTAANVISYVQKSKLIQQSNIGSAPLSNIFNGSIIQVSQQQSFNMYLKIIYAMMQKLSNAMKGVEQVQGTFYWLPIPSATGPDGGSTVRGVPLNSNISTTLMTPYDFDIIFSQAQSLVSGLMPTIAEPTATPDPGNFAFSGHDITFDGSTTNSFGDQSTKTQDNLSAKREKLLSRGGDALQVAEMIMGEFSGLGLVDIIAIMGGLYVMPFNSLLGFLDNDAIIRAEQSLGAPSMSLQNARRSLTTAMDSLAQSVNGFYQVMDAIFQDVYHNNSLNST